MTRKEKIYLLKRIREGKENFKSLFLKNNHPIPSWLWQQYITEEELITDLKRTFGENVRVIWYEGKPYVINNNPKSKKPSWFVQ